MPDQSFYNRPPIIEQLRAEIRGLPYRPAKRKKNEAAPVPCPEDGRYLFTVCSGSRWMELGARQPAAKMLFGEFWYEHEICFLFANTNTGKSVLAVQIGEAIAGRRKAGPFPCQAKPAQVLYADFELSTLQFHRRYSHPNMNMHFTKIFSGQSLTLQVSELNMLKILNVFATTNCFWPAWSIASGT